MARGARRGGETIAEATIAPYGSWRSEVTAGLIASGAAGISDLAVGGDAVYWIETRPAEAGRSVIVRRGGDGVTKDVTPPDLSARTRVHEYGGGAFCVDGDSVFFSNFADHRLYRQDGDGPPRPITPESAMRFADAVVDGGRGRLICVAEEHGDGAREAVNCLVTVSTEVGVDVEGEGAPRTLVAGHDFFAAPRLSPDGSRLAWLSWDHPRMPWDGSDLWLADVGADGSLGEPRRIAGGESESVGQPRWSPDGVLYFVSDRSGWWNLYRYAGDGVDDVVVAVAPMEAEFGQPDWVFGQSTYAFVSAELAICAVGQDGVWQLARLHLPTGELTPLDSPHADRPYLRTMGDKVVFIGGSPSRASAVIEFDPGSSAFTTLYRAAPDLIDEEMVSLPEAIAFPTEDSPTENGPTEGGRTAHAFYYAPRHPDFAAPEGELPPLIVRIHGGPTAATSDTLNLRIQYWTSRGFAVVDVNYGGSTGYGRAYRQRLNGQWGVVDVEDCVNAAKYLVARGDVDAARMAITGGSAGGYTTLCALTFHDVFAAGASHYGVSDVAALARDTHKFESRYMDSLIGPYPERDDLYRERSPIHFTDGLTSPMIFFQGLDDPVVPPNQAETMVEALRSKGIPVAYVPFEGEQHGFRQAKNIVRALEGELYFYGRIFGFEPADALEPVTIENL